VWPGRESRSEGLAWTSRGEMLGAHGHSEWFDLSDLVVHFTKGGDTQGYKTIMSILGQRRLLRGPGAFGAARDIHEVAESQRVVCFSEVPLGFLDRIAKRRDSKFGVAFHKRFVLDHGGAPIWYLEHDTPQQVTFARMIQDARRRGPDPADPIWGLTPFVDFPSGPASPYTYDFRWEREWRAARDIAFKEEDVAFLFIPEDKHGQARLFFTDAVQENFGPGYFCPYVDPSWSVERVRDALRTAREF
jgi:hypothetical protein